jgi:Flp pilus assembly protein TadG
MTSLLFRVRKLWRNDEAVAAVEFAIVVPFLLALYIGGIELANGMAINVKVSATAHSVADMVSQNTSLSTAQMQNILTGASSIIAPYPVSGGSGSLMTVTVSEISSDANGNLTLRWSQSYNGASFGPGRTNLTNLTMPTSLNGAAANVNNPNGQNDNVSFILGEVTYAYTPNMGYAITGTVTLADSVYIFPRCSTNSPANSSGPAYYDIKYTTTTTTCNCIQHLQQKTC